jgi:hypothetical protein
MSLQVIFQQIIPKLKEMRNAYTIFVKIPEKRDHFDGKIVLECI